MAEFTVRVIREMAFSESCDLEVEAESWDEAQDQAYDLAFNGEPEWDSNTPEQVSWHMQDITPKQP